VCVCLFGNILLNFFAADNIRAHTLTAKGSILLYIFVETYYLIGIATCDVIQNYTNYLLENKRNKLPSNLIL